MIPCGMFLAPACSTLREVMEKARGLAISLTRASLFSVTLG
jgi:hypothetical protein